MMSNANMALISRKPDQGRACGGLMGLLIKSSIASSPIIPWAKIPVFGEKRTLFRLGWENSWENKLVRLCFEASPSICRDHEPHQWQFTGCSWMSCTYNSNKRKYFKLCNQKLLVYTLCPHIGLFGEEAYICEMWNLSKNQRKRKYIYRHLIQST